MTPETKAFVEQCEARANKATPGPIDVHRYDNGGGDIRWQLQQADDAPVKDAGGIPIALTDFSDLDNPNARNDAEFYARSRANLLEALRIIREQDAEIERLRPDAEAWRKGWETIRQLQERVIPCGHKIEDLIGGEGSVTKCGACLAPWKTVL